MRLRLKSIKLLSLIVSLFILFVVDWRLTGQDLPNTNNVITPAFDERSKIDDNTNYKVTRVIDGDTIEVAISGQVEKIRLIGINTPETVDPRKPVECFGKEASDHAKALLEGQSVKLGSDSTQADRDKYNRLLRYVRLPDGRNFNKLMIAEGYAYEYTYEIPYKYQSEFKAAELQARQMKKGLWADRACPKKH